MKKGKGVIVAVAIGLMGSAGWAADKSSSSFVDASSLAGGSNGFSNGVSSGKDKAASCKVKIQIKGLTGFSDGDQIICIASADVRSAALGNAASGIPVGNSVVILAPWSDLKQQAQGKADLSLIGCGTTTAINVGGDLECYKPDAAYLADLAGAATACTGNTGMFWGNPSSTPKDNLVGLCQGTLAAGAGARIDPPSSGKILQHGGYNPMK